MKVNLATFTAAAALCLLFASCAQTGPPLPPSLELPKPVSDLHAIRKGDRVTLTWSEPTLTTDRQSLRYIGPTLVCRSLEAEITTCGTPVATLPPPAVPPKHTSSKITPKKTEAQKTAAPPPTPQAYLDTLPPNLQQENANAEVTYAVEILNLNARGAGLSDRVHVPAVIALPPPADFMARLTGDGVVLSWTGIGEPPPVPSIEHRYRIYRREVGPGEGSPSNQNSGNERPGNDGSGKKNSSAKSADDKNANKDAIAGEVPFGEPGPAHFTDSGFEWEKTYLYRLTAVTIVRRAESEEQVEGDDTPPVQIFAHDIFPPAVPDGLQAVYSGEGQKPFIDLIWAPVTNVDLAGYNVFRSEADRSENGASGVKLQKLNSELVKSPSYRDSAVTSGKTYTYAVSAVDVRGNESQRSEPASESVP
jgi:stringent starvation protein B